MSTTVQIVTVKITETRRDVDRRKQKRRCMRLFKRQPKPLRCVYCGRDEFEIPRFSTDEEAERMRCPKGQYHLFSADPHVRALALTRLAPSIRSDGNAA